MWFDLQHEKMRRDLVKSTISGGSSSSGTKQVKEEEDVALASKRQQEQRRRKKDISKIKCFRCGDLGHYNTQCPLRKKHKEENQDQQATSTEIDRLSFRLEEQFSMIIKLSSGVRWGVLTTMCQRPIAVHPLF